MWLFSSHTGDMVSTRICVAKAAFIESTALAGRKRASLALLESIFFTRFLLLRKHDEILCWAHSLASTAVKRERGVRPPQFQSERFTALELTRESSVHQTSGNTCLRSDNVGICCSEGSILFSYRTTQGRGARQDERDARF